MSSEEKRKFDVEKMTLGTQKLDEYVKIADRDRFKMAFVAGGQGGGKIAAEFCRFGYPLVAYNTCKEDLDDLEEKINNMQSHGDFVRIDLDGYGGAAKDRDLGLKAIQDNIPKLKDKLLIDRNLHEADFVWVVVALGGGTGNGSLASVCKMLADYVRVGQEKRTYINGRWYPTLGVIAAVPDQAVKTKIKVNVAQAIEQLELLQEAGLLGSVLLVDNQKLIDDFRKNYIHSRDMHKTWVEDGNNKVSRVITELALTTSLKSSNMLDVAELKNIWSSPGFMTIGKNELTELWMVDKCIEDKKEDLPYGNEEFSNRKEFMGKMLKDSFSESVFVEGTDLPSAINGGMVVITDGENITSMDAKDLEDALAMEVFNESNAIGSPHSGFITTEFTGVISEKEDHPEKESEEGKKLAGRIFTMCVSKGAPEYIKIWFEKAIKSKEQYEDAIKSIKEDKGLQGFSAQINSMTNTQESAKLAEISLESMFGGLSNMNAINSERKSSLDDLDKFFNNDIFGSNNLGNPNNQGNTDEKTKGLIKDIFSI